MLTWCPSVYHFRLHSHWKVATMLRLCLHIYIRKPNEETDNFFDCFLTSVFCLSLQAVPYSREFKQKYDYFRKKLKKPVRLSILCL